MTQDYSGFRPSKLWRRLPAERRTAAAELFWGDEQSAEQQVEACATIATHMKFRAKSVLNLPVDKKTRYLVNLPQVSDAVAARALVNYHLGLQRPMMGDFLDALGQAEGRSRSDCGEVSGRGCLPVLVHPGLAGSGDVGRAGTTASDNPRVVQTSLHRDFQGRALP
jgi:hypothetical protein